jgi:mannosyltransferase OCH1-like enzyme
MFHHPDWEFRSWREADLAWLHNGALFDKATSYAQKADIARYEIVERFGGVYLDVDVECLRPIDEVMKDLDFLGARQPGGSMATCMFGAWPGHPLLHAVIARIPVSCLVFRWITTQTGPGLFTRVIDDGRWESRPGVRIFSPAFLFPGWSEPSRREETSPSAFVVHHQSHSWKGDSPVVWTWSDLRANESPPQIAKALVAEAIGRLKSRAPRAARPPSPGGTGAAAVRGRSVGRLE